MEVEKWERVRRTEELSLSFFLNPPPSQPISLLLNYSLSLHLFHPPDEEQRQKEYTAAASACEVAITKQEVQASYY